MTCEELILTLQRATPAERAQVATIVWGALPVAPAPVAKAGEALGPVATSPSPTKP